MSAQFDELSPEWLFDTGCYLTHLAISGAGLVALKAAGFGVLGVLLARTGMRSGTGSFVATFCAGIAVLGFSLAANVWPISVTLIAFGLLMWCMRERSDDRPQTLWPVFVLFLIWANSDRGFITGLLVTLCIWMGRTLDVKAGRATRGFGWWPLGLIFVALLNPIHFAWRFPLPLELGWLTNGIGNRYPNVAAVIGPGADYPSPLTQNYVEQYLDSPARLAYYPLLIVGALAFVLNFRQLRWQRLLPWLFMAGLSAVTDRAVPVFAIVGGPILALNLRELFAKSTTDASRRPSRFWSVPIGIVGVAFLVAAWPGWLQEPPYEPRRWAVEIPNSPQAACELLQEYRTTNRFASGTRTLHLSPESAKIFGWFDPADKGAFDAELANALATGQPHDIIEKRMRDGRFTRLALYHPNVEQLRRFLPAILSSPREWPLLFVRGGVAVFGWRDSGEPAATHGLDLTDPWFDLSDPERADVPNERYRTRPTDSHRWSEQVHKWFVTPAPVPSIHRDEAAIWLMMANVSSGFVPMNNRDAWPVEQWVGLVGSAGAFSNPITAGADTAVRVGYAFTPSEPAPPLPSLANPINMQFQLAQRAKSDCLIGPLFASIRASRRAIAETPDEPSAHLLLGEAYLQVMTTSRYRAWVAPDKFRKAADLLQSQTVAAYQRGIELSRKPPYQANKQLAELYDQIGYLDLPLKHLREARVGRKPIANELARRKLDDREGQSLDSLIERLDKVVAEQQTLFNTETSKALTIDRVKAAHALRLQGRALELLLESDVSAFGSEGTNMQLNLLLRTGRADNVIDWTTPTLDEQGFKQNPVQNLLGPRSYHWFRGQALAASGASVEADEELASIEGGTGALLPDAQFLGQRAALITADKVLAETPRVLGVPDSIGRLLLQIESERQMTDLQRQLQDMAEVCVLRAMIAAESGDLAKTKSLCQAVLEFSPMRTGRVEDPLRRIANDFLTQLVAHERAATRSR